MTTKLALCDKCGRDEVIAKPDLVPHDGEFPEKEGARCLLKV